MPKIKTNSILPAPIYFNADELLYLYNKCNENLHLLSISYSLARGELNGPRGESPYFRERYVDCS